MQRKRHSHIEVLTNQIVGIAIGWWIVYAIFPMLSALNQSQLASASTAIFFVASYIRSYTIRRIFNNIERRHNE